jgi:Thioredoxin like C-terminal domain
VPADYAAVHGGGTEAAANFDEAASPETYVGYMRTEDFASPDGVLLDQPKTYSAPAKLALNQWALAGTWNVGPESASLGSAPGRVVLSRRQ